jgi:hypothetical protein
MPDCKNFDLLFGLADFVEDPIVSLTSFTYVADATRRTSRTEKWRRRQKADLLYDSFLESACRRRIVVSDMVDDLVKHPERGT